MSTVREALADDGRYPSTFGIAKLVYIGVDDDAERGQMMGMGDELGLVKEA